MKKFTWSLPLLVLLSLITTSESRAQVRYGLEAGLNIANVVGDDSHDNVEKYGLHAGFFFEYKVSDRVRFAPSLLYSMKGTTDNVDNDISLSLDYLEVPFLVQYRIVKRLSVAAGPYAGYLIRAEYHNHDIDVDVNEQFADFDAGLALRVNYDFEERFGLHVSYSQGLTNIDEFDDTSDNQNIAARIGLSYRFGKE